MLQKTRLLKFTRRDFIKTSGALLVGTLAAGSSVLKGLAPSTTWALELNALSPSVGQILLKVARHIFPHETLDDAVYALVVKDLDVAAADNEVLAGMLAEGAADLNKLAKGDWLAAGTERQAELVAAMQDTLFFEKIRSTAVVSLYNNDMAWAHFGYEGPSWPKGGYLNRGFQDLQWLPDPPAEASPKPA